MTATMQILGLDVSLRSTGWAAITYETGDLVDCGLVTSTPGSDYVETLGHIYAEVRDLARRHLHADIAMEDGISYLSGTVTRQLAGAWSAAALAATHALGAPVAAVNVATVKKTATGRGNATKALVTAAAVERWGDGVNQSDIADACWVAEAHRLWLHAHFDNQGDIA